MTHDEDTQAVTEYVKACAKLLRIRVSDIGCLEIAERMMVKYDGSRAQIMVQLTPLTLNHMIHAIMAEDIRTAEEIREELAKSTRQIPLELHPDDVGYSLRSKSHNASQLGREGLVASMNAGAVDSPEDINVESCREKYCQGRINHEGRHWDSGGTWD